MTYPEIDFLFDLLTGFKNLPTTLLGTKQWLSKLQDEQGSPVTIIRDLIKQKGINLDQALTQVGLKLWSQDLDMSSFKKTLRKLDHTFSDQFCESLFKSLKNREGKVEVKTLMNNVFGKETETTEFRAKMFKDLYSIIFQ